MRIAMVSEHASPLAVLGGVDAGGQNVHVAALSLALAARGHDVTVYTRRDDPDVPLQVSLGPGVEVVNVPAGPPEQLPKDELLPFMPEFGRWLAATWSREVLPDVVHAHFWMSGLAALHATQTTAVPVVQTFHALGSVKRRYQGNRDTSPADRIALETRIGQEVDMIVATCTDEAAELRRMGVERDRIRVVPCGVDTSLFSPLTPTAELIAAASAPPRRRRLLCVGRLVERKGVDTAIRALTELPEFELVVAGGPEKRRLATDPEARRLLLLAEELGVADRVQLLGSVDHDLLPALIRSADLVVCTPWYEPFGIVPIEAAACGRVVVGSAVGGLLDTVVDGETGRLVSGNDPSAVAAAVQDVIRDPLRKRRFEVAARYRAVALYDWDSVAAATAGAYLSLVGRTQPAQVIA
jgi:D-inositol-3-phosphate glycosyltransferase